MYAGVVLGGFTGSQKLLKLILRIILYHAHYKSVILYNTHHMYYEASRQLSLKGRVKKQNPNYACQP